jgi:hypothetical protein
VAGGATVSHYITSIAGSFTAAVAGKVLQLKDDTTVIGEFAVHNSFVHNFAKPMKITANKDASLVLAASGTGGVLGKVTLSGYTI